MASEGLYYYKGKGRSEWKKRGGGVGILVRKEANIEFHEIDVKGGKMAEDIMAGTLEYKSGRTSKKTRIIVV